MSQLFVEQVTFDSEPAGAGARSQRDAGEVHDSYPRALLERENLSTGIALERPPSLSPHCEAVHAKSPAIYHSSSR